MGLFNKKMQCPDCFVFYSKGRHHRCDWETEYARVVLDPGFKVMGFTLDDLIKIRTEVNRVDSEKLSEIVNV